jgi:hypothetical protein
MQTVTHGARAPAGTVEMVKLALGTSAAAPKTLSNDGGLVEAGHHLDGAMPEHDPGDGRCDRIAVTAVRS